MTTPEKLLEERIAELEALTPKHIFRTKDRYENRVTTEEGGSVTLEQYHGSILIFFPVPGYVDKVRYKDFSFGSPWGMNSARNSDGSRVRSIYDTDEDTLYAFSIADQEYTLSLRQPGNSALKDRVDKVFKEYKTFEQTTKKKHRWLKPIYDTARAIRETFIKPSSPST